MSIDHVSVRFQSDSLRVFELEQIAGRTSTRSAEKGSPISSRQPSAGKHTVSTASFEKHGSWDELGPYIDELVPVLKSAGPQALAGVVQVDLVIAMTARPMGFIIEVNAAQIAVLGSIRCGLIVDSYSGEHG